MARKKRITRHEIVPAFSRRLREARRKQGLSQQDLALKAKTTLSYVGKLERGEIAPGLDIVGRLSDALGIDPATLVTKVPDGTKAKRAMKKHARELVEKVLQQNDEASIQAMAVVAGLMYSALARSPDKPSR